MNNFKKFRQQKKHMTAQERKTEKDRLIAYKTKGYGLYEYQNRLAASLTLPKFASDGKTKYIPAGGTFQGDDYFMFMVPSELRVKQIIIPADEERKKEIMENQKLILDQPETVTNEGVVERVVVGDLPLNENDPQTGKKKEVLINEDPIDGVKIILG